MRSKIKEEIKFNYENMKKIDEKYNELVTDIVCYIRVKLDEKDGEEAINDILDMLLSAQERGEDLNDFVNNDYISFCNSIIEVYRGNNKLYELKNIKEITIVILKMIPFFLALNCVANILGKLPISFKTLINSSFNIGLIPVLGIILSIPMVYLVFYIISKPSEKAKDFSMMFISNILYMLILVLIGIYCNITLISIPNYFICTIISIIILGVYAYFLFVKRKI